MNELGQTIIENYNTFAPKNMVLEWLKIILTPLSTLIIGIFTIAFTIKNLRKSLLDNLDDKSEWRKKLLELAGKGEIRKEDVHTLRSFVRFKKHDDSTNNLSYFKQTTNNIIDYCKYLSKNYYQPHELTYTKSYKDKRDNSFEEYITKPSVQEQEMVRIFARYLLADHWEVLQLSNAEQYKYNCEKGYPNDKYNFIQKFNIKIIKTLFCKSIDSKVQSWIKKEEELYFYTLEEFLKLQKINEYKDLKTALDNYKKKSNK